MSRTRPAGNNRRTPKRRIEQARQITGSRPASGWAVTQHSRGAHDEGGAIIHATPRHKRIEYARRIAHRAAGRFVYNEQEYGLEVEEQPVDGERLLPFRGAIHNLRTGHIVPFRIWLEDGSDAVVPVRIEFQPRSFPRLTCEAVGA